MKKARRVSQLPSHYRHCFPSLKLQPVAGAIPSAIVPSLSSTIMKIWLLPVDSHFDLIDVGLFPVDIDKSKTIYDLKRNIDSSILERLNVKHTDFYKVWKTKDHVTATSEVDITEILKDSKGLEENIRKNFKQLLVIEVVDNLGLSDGQILLLQAPGMSRIFTAPRNFFRQPCTNQPQRCSRRYETQT